MFIFTNIVNKLESFKNKVYRMSKQGAISGQWMEGANKIECTLPLILFKENNCFISYCPALDLNGYGANELEANKSFEDVLSEYFRYTLHKKTLAEDLKKMGWTIRKNIRKCPIPPAMDTFRDFLKYHGLKHIFIIHNCLRTMNLTSKDLRDYLNSKN